MTEDSGIQPLGTAQNATPRELSTSYVDVTTADGHQLSVYRSEPVGGGIAGLVVLQEIFGVNRHIREVCDGYARLGFSVVAPALFDRVARKVDMDYGAESIERGRQLRAKIDWDESILDVQAAIDEVKDLGPVAVLGYCWGGTLAFLAATRMDSVGCAIAYYGGQTVPFAQETPRVPVMMHFGERDPRIPAADREIIHAANPGIEMHVFAADHGFNCDHRDEYDKPSAEKALRLSLDFMAKHLNLEGKI